MWDDFKNWSSKPFSVDMDAMHWFLFIGLLIVINVGWAMVLTVIREET